MRSRAATAPTANKREERRMQLLLKQRQRLEQEVNALESDILALVWNATSDTNALQTYTYANSNTRDPFDHSGDSFLEVSCHGHNTHPRRFGLFHETDLCFPLLGPSYDATSFTGQNPFTLLALCDDLSYPHRVRYDSRVMYDDIMTLLSRWSYHKAGYLPHVRGTCFPDWWRGNTLRPHTFR